MNKERLRPSDLAEAARGSPRKLLDLFLHAAPDHLSTGRSRAQISGCFIAGAMAEHTALLTFIRRKLLMETFTPDDEVFKALTELANHIAERTQGYFSMGKEILLVSPSDET